MCGQNDFLTLYPRISLIPPQKNDQASSFRKKFQILHGEIPNTEERPICERQKKKLN